MNDGPSNGVHAVGLGGLESELPICMSMTVCQLLLIGGVPHGPVLTRAAGKKEAIQQVSTSVLKRYLRQWLESQPLHNRVTIYV